MRKRLGRSDGGRLKAVLPALLALAAACAEPKATATASPPRRYEGEFEFKDKAGQTQKIPFSFEDVEKASTNSPQGAYRVTVIERTGMLSEAGTLVFVAPAGRDLDMKRRVSEGLDPARDPDVVLSAEDSCAVEASWLSESRLRLKVPSSCRVVKKTAGREALTITYE